MDRAVAHPTAMRFVVDQDSGSQAANESRTFRVGWDASRGRF